MWLEQQFDIFPLEYVFFSCQELNEATASRTAALMSVFSKMVRYCVKAEIAVLHCFSFTLQIPQCEER